MIFTLLGVKTRDDYFFFGFLLDYFSFIPLFS